MIAKSFFIYMNLFKLSLITITLAFGQGVYATEAIFQEKITSLEKSANDGNAESLLRLGVIYRSGDFTQQNLDLAKYWFNRAATNAHADAQEILGL